MDVTLDAEKAEVECDGESDADAEEERVCL